MHRRQSNSTARTPPLVGVIGSLCSGDLVLADALIAAGIPTTVLRSALERELGDRSRDLFPHLRRFDVVFSFTASVGFALDRLMYAYPALERLGWPPYINVSTGAEITERALGPGRVGVLQRFTMRRAFAQGVPPYPEAVRTAARMGLSNATVSGRSERRSGRRYS